MDRIHTTKAYKNEDFLASESARYIRILCECSETQQRLKEYNISATILFFGSARAKTEQELNEVIQSLQKKVDAAKNAEDAELVDTLEKKIKVMEKSRWMCAYYEKILQLSRRLTEWSTLPATRLSIDHSVSGVTRYHHRHDSHCLSEDSSHGGEDSNQITPHRRKQAIFVCTGGGPGFMEAANKGASQVKGAGNIGMGITLPFEDGLNPYVSQELAFEFHYFFTRKLWMVFFCQALVVAPGGLGTMDELFEVLTLRQTGKVQKDLPVVLIGKDYWNAMINWKALVELGVVSESDISDLFFTDDVDAAFNYVTTKLTHGATMTAPIGTEIKNGSSVGSNGEVLLQPVKTVVFTEQKNTTIDA